MNCSEMNECNTTMNMMKACVHQLSGDYSQEAVEINVLPGSTTSRSPGKMRSSSSQPTSFAALAGLATISQKQHEKIEILILIIYLTLHLNYRNEAGIPFSGNLYRGLSILSVVASINFSINTFTVISSYDRKH